MLTYEYECEACGSHFIVEQKISEEPYKKCWNCGELKLKRLIAGSSFVLKGQNWEKKDGY